LIKIFTLTPSLAVALTGNGSIGLDGTLGAELRGDFVLRLDLRADLLELLKKLVRNLGPINNVEATWTVAEKKWNIFKLPKSRVSGSVENAIDRSPIPGATIVFREAENGPEKTSALTNSEGKFEVTEITSNRYYVEVSADGYIPYKSAVDIDTDDPNPLTFALSPMDDNFARVVLTWGLTPADLDSHISGPRVDGTRFHVYFENMSDSGNANLDVDDVTSFGPETVTLISKNPGTYRYSIHDYTNRDASSSSALMNSGVTVKLYLQDGHSYSYTGPRGNGTLWTVFEIRVNQDGTYSVVPINTMSYEQSPVSVRSSTFNKKQTK
jgi:hypothetical protein